MFKIVKITLYKLRNGEYFRFMSTFKSLLDILTPAALHSEDEFAEFCSVLTKLDDELRVDKGSVLIEELHTIDLDRDSVWRAIDMRIDATLLCTLEKEMEAAKRLRRVFDLYGNIRYLSYNEETAACSNLTDDLDKEENATQCATIGITKWVNALKNQNVDFKTLQNQRDTEATTKNSGNVKEARLLLDPFYEEIVNRINAMVTLKMVTPEIETFIKEVNQKIKYYEDTLAARAGRKDTEEEREHAFPEQED